MVAARGSGETSHRAPEFAHHDNQCPIELPAGFQIREHAGDAVVERLAQRVEPASSVRAVDIGMHVPTAESDLSEARPEIGVQDLGSQQAGVAEAGVPISAAVACGVVERACDVAAIHQRFRGFTEVVEVVKRFPIRRIDAQGII